MINDRNDKYLTSVNKKVFSNVPRETLKIFNRHSTKHSTFVPYTPPPIYFPGNNCCTKKHLMIY